MQHLASLLLLLVQLLFYLKQHLFFQRTPSATIRNFFFSHNLSDTFILLHFYLYTLYICLRRCITYLSSITVFWMLGFISVISSSAWNISMSLLSHLSPFPYFPECCCWMNFWKYLAFAFISSSTFYFLSLMCLLGWNESLQDSWYYF